MVVEKKHTLFYFRRKEYFQSYAMLAPWLLGFFLFTIYPILWIIRMSFFEYDGFSPAKFTGSYNYVRLFTRDPDFWQATINTFILAFGKLAIELPLALILAVILNNKLKGRTLFRVTFFMPNVISVAIIAVIFYFMFSTYGGIVNNVFMSLGLIEKAIDWFGNKWTSMLVLAVSSIWQNFGINMIFLLTGLQSVPQDIYECAEIDGATGFDKFIHITIPMLAPIMQVVFLIAMLGSLKITDLVLVLTNGDPAGSTEVMMTYIFKHFFAYGASNFVNMERGYAACCGVIASIILGILTAIYLRLTRRMGKID